MSCLSTAWDRHLPELRNWLRHRQRDRALVDDLLQDIFLKALRFGDRFDAVQNPRAWLFEVARNRLADHLRVARDNVELPDDLPAPVFDPDTVDTLTTCLPRVLSELSEEDREALTLCDLQGMAQAEFARAKGLGLSAAKSRVQRARLRLRERLSQACQVQLDEVGHVADFVPRP